jgi:hypothetical protein
MFHVRRVQLEGEMEVYIFGNMKKDVFKRLKLSKIRFKSLKCSLNVSECQRSVSKRQH